MALSQGRIDQGKAEMADQHHGLHARACDLGVRIDVCESGYTASTPAHSGIFGWGPTVDSAIGDLIGAIDDGAFIDALASASASVTIDSDRP